MPPKMTNGINQPSISKLVKVECMTSGRKSIRLHNENLTKGDQVSR